MQEGLPRHIAIIMDGNGRWAEKRSLPRIKGHYSGTKVVSEIIEVCARIGIEALTLYSFSTENWKRPKKEVDALMGLFEQNLRMKAGDLKKNNMRFNVIGRTEGLSRTLRDLIEKTRDMTADNDGMLLTLAINYGGRQEIIDAVKILCKKVKEEKFDISSISEDIFKDYLYDRNLSDPDLIIRTSGEMRISNFLLWQLAYSEFYVTNTLWPDFNKAELEKALSEYKQRKRRFGE